MWVAMCWFGAFCRFTFLVAHGCWRQWLEAVVGSGLVYLMTTGSGWQ